MVVDDEKDITTLLKELLEREGYDVVAVSDGKKCLNRVKSTKPKLIILDIMMPEVNGWDVCREIKEKQRNPPAICMLSVRREADDRKKSMEYAHADAHMSKPIDINEITEMVRKLLKK